MGGRYPFSYTSHHIAKPFLFSSHSVFSSRFGSMELHIISGSNKLYMIVIVNVTELVFLAKNRKVDPLLWPF